MIVLLNVVHLVINYLLFCKMLYTLVAVDLIVQHIKDLLKGRGMRVKQSPRVRTVDPLQIYLSTDPTGSDPVLHSPSPVSTSPRPH